MNAIEIEIKRNEEQRRQQGEQLALLKKIAPLFKDGETSSAYVSGYSREVSFNVASEVDLRLLVRRVMKAMKLRLVKRDFDSSTGEAIYLLKVPDEKHPKAITLTFTAGKTSCRVKRITEEVEEPAHYEPARMVTKTRYVIENPEECLGGIGPEASVTTAKEATANE